MNLIIDVFEKGTNYWLVRTKGGEWYENFVGQKYISIDTSGINKVELQDLHTKEDIKTFLDKKIQQKIRNFDSNYEGQKDRHFLDAIGKFNKAERSKSHISTRIYSFFNEMKVGDLVLIPSQYSKFFAIGVIRSEPYELEYDISETNSLPFGSSNKPQISNKTLIRDVEWISFKTRHQIPLELLNSFLTVHHSIISLNEYKFYFQSLINPFFIDEDNKLNMRIEIKKRDGLDVNDWKSLYNYLGTIEEISETKFKEVKSDVQSPGYISIVEYVEPVVTSLKDMSPNILGMLLIYKWFNKNSELVSKFILRSLPENRSEAKLKQAKHELEMAKIEQQKQSITNSVQKNLKSEVNVIVEDDDQKTNSSDD